MTHSVPSAFSYRMGLNWVTEDDLTPAFQCWRKNHDPAIGFLVQMNTHALSSRAVFLCGRPDRGLSLN